MTIQQFPVLLLVLCTWAAKIHASPWAPFQTDPAWQSPGCGLQKAFIGRKPWSPLYPELQANYWTFGWRAEDLGAQEALRIKGVFAELRYLSWTLYDSETGDFLSHLNDAMIEADPDSEGPLQSYTLRVVSEEAGQAERSNQLIVPRKVRKPVLVLRYYEEYQAPNPYGSQKLPRIERVALVDDTVRMCPPPLGWQLPAGNAKNIVKAVWDSRKMKNPELQFYRVKGAGLYPNPDNIYVSTRLFTEEFGDTAILRVKLPEQAEIGRGGLIRYQSFCIGNLLNTLTPKNGCVMDRALPRDAEGWTTLVISDRADVRAEATRLGYASLAKGTRFPLILMRQMLAKDDFPGSLKAVPMTEGSGDLEGKAADLFIGDYAPRGFYCSAESFLKLGLACHGPAL